MESRTAPTDHPVHDLIAQRWSPYIYSGASISIEDLSSLFEAARWAPSSYNEQPWTYLVARREDEQHFARLLECLVEPNRAWAQAASVLALGVASLQFQRNGKPNGHALHDLGLASANLTVEAAARGLMVHQMAGILPDHAAEVCRIPEGWQAATALAIGAPGDPGTGPEELASRDQAPRSRKPLSEFIFTSEWGEKALG